MSLALSSLSDNELISSLTALVGTEQRTLCEIVFHLSEVSKRRLHAELGYSSLYDYATRGLGYSNSAAQRRIKAARVVAEYPEVGEMLENGCLSLGTVGMLADVITSMNADELLDAVIGKSQAEVERIVSRYRAPSDRVLRDKIERMVVASAEVERAQSELFKGDGLSMTTTAAEETTKLGDNLLSDEVFRISFTATPQLKAKIDRAKELMYAGYGSVELEAIFSRALDAYLQKTDPRGRQERRSAYKLSRLRRKAAKENQAQRELDEKKQKERKSRYIPVAVRDQVFARDGYCCSFVGANGIRCSATTCLEVDHIDPVALGGTGKLSNLRTLCKSHNLHYARQAFPTVDAILAQLQEMDDAIKDLR